MALWTALVPLIVGGAIVPVQLAITVLLVRGDRGVRRASAWVAGRAAVMVAQGVLFGFIFTSPVADAADAGSDDASSPIVSTLLLVVAIIFLAGALKQMFAHVDPDAAPPRWMAALDGIGAGRAFLLGVGLMAVGAKFWVFTLSAVGVISEETMGSATSIATFLLFVVLSSITHLAIIAVVAIAPRRSKEFLDALSGWLTRHNRALMIVLGLVFGTWFAGKALDGFGVY